MIARPGRIWILCGLGALLAALPTSAKPPPNPDPSLSAWFRSLTRPWRPGSGATVKCCDMADCRVTDFRLPAGTMARCSASCAPRRPSA